MGRPSRQSKRKLSCHVLDSLAILYKTGLPVVSQKGAGHGNTWPMTHSPSKSPLLSALSLLFAQHFRPWSPSCGGARGVVGAPRCGTCMGGGTPALSREGALGTGGSWDHSGEPRSSRRSLLGSHVCQQGRGGPWYPEERGWAGLTSTSLRCARPCHGFRNGSAVLEMLLSRCSP